jgi:hypothetical protein
MTLLVAMLEMTFVLEEGVLIGIHALALPQLSHRVNVSNVSLFKTVCYNFI